MAACAACPGAAAASIIRAAPMRHPARDSASRASPVSAVRLPGPSPTTATSGFAEKPNRRQRSSTVSAAESPSRCGGRPMMTGTAPVSAAAAIFSSNPPALPEAFVTRYAAPMLRSRAALSSLENGPCIARMCAGGSPASRQARSESSIGSTRA